MVESDLKDVSDHASILAAIQSAQNGETGKGDRKVFLEELSAALDDDDGKDEEGNGSLIFSKEQLFFELEKRYLTPSTQIDKTLLAASQM